MKSIAGYVFLGTPLIGSDLALSTWTTRAVTRAMGLDSHLMDFLAKGNEHALGRLRDFCGATKGVDIVCFYEEDTTQYLKGLGFNDRVCCSHVFFNTSDSQTSDCRHVIRYSTVEYHDRSQHKPLWIE